MYAVKTAVPIERSRAEIEKLIQKYGADQFVSGWNANAATVGFRMENRFVQFRLPLARQCVRKWDREQNRYIGEDVSQEKAAQINRARWRALVLVLKAKLESAFCLEYLDKKIWLYLFSPNDTGMAVVFLLFSRRNAGAFDFCNRSRHRSYRQSIGTTSSRFAWAQS